MPMAFTVGLTPVEMHDQLLATQVEGARHDRDLCPFCAGRETASEQAQPPAPVPSGDEPSGAPTTTTTPTTEGGTPDMTAAVDTKTMTVETHEALQAKAVSDAVSTTEKALETKTAEAKAASDELASAKAELETSKSEVARLNGELDKAQLDLKAATDEVATLKEAETTREEAARVAETASKRTEQVKALKLFPDEYVQEKASAWAALSDEDWNARVDEWAKAAPTKGEGTGTSDTASAMTGTTGTTTTDPTSDTASGDKPPARRAVLGLS